MSDKIQDYEKIQKAINAATGGKKIRGFAKWLTYTIIIVAFAMGVIGSFDAVKFNMAEYTSFLPTAAMFVVPLIISIGASSVTEKVQRGKKEREIAVAQQISSPEPKPELSTEKAINIKEAAVG